MEARHDLLSHESEGWAVWPLFRFAAAHRLQHLSFDANRAVVSRGEKFRLACRDVFKLLRLPRARVVVKSYSTAHMETEAGRKKDVYFDDFLRVAGSHFKLEIPNQPQFHRQRHARVFPPDLSTVALSGLAKIMGRRPPARVRRVAADLSAALRTEAELESFTPATVAGTIAVFHAETRLYRMLLRRVRPSWVLLGEAGDYATTAAARQLGISVVEFQHGFTHRHFPGNSWARAALRHKPRMALPHRMFLYGRHWANELAAHGFWSDELRVVGSLRIDSHRERPVNRSQETATFLVTTQGVETGPMIAFLRAALGGAGEQCRYRCVIKTHPLYHGSDREFAAAFGGNPAVQIVAGSELPSTFDLLREAHLHLSIASTCHYEALALGVPTVILPFAGSESVRHLHESGHAFLPRHPGELSEILLRWRDHRVPAGAGDEYFTPGALANIQRELAALEMPGST